MSDLIDRQVAIDALAKEMPSLTTPDGSGKFDHDIQIADEAFVDCMQIINELPSAQPQRMRGKWTYGEDEYGIDGYHCDKCGFFVPWDYTHKFIDFIKDYHFCPNCGADMRGEQDGSNKD